MTKDKLITRKEMMTKRGIDDKKRNWWQKRGIDDIKRGIDDKKEE